ncbi:MAG: hypothetical protein J0H63_07815 [Rhizobiales bacterium]|nr:hypothetical protein [Hyphomicrobiales bacterium]MBN9010033.1 hypothetical protein [Hyphomicrobiales bacterium]
MAKVVFGKLGAKRPRSTVPTKRVRDGEGRVVVLRTLDANSATFGTDFRDVFERNVVKARRENRKLTGTADGIVRKD